MKTAHNEAAESSFFARAGVQKAERKNTKQRYLPSKDI
jgi:hypothetical protein